MVKEKEADEPTKPRLPLSLRWQYAILNGLDPYNDITLDHKPLIYGSESCTLLHIS